MMKNGLRWIVKNIVFLFFKYSINISLKFWVTFCNVKQLRYKWHANAKYEKEDQGLPNTLNNVTKHIGVCAKHWPTGHEIIPKQRQW